MKKKILGGILVCVFFLPFVSYATPVTLGQFFDEYIKTLPYTRSIEYINVYYPNLRRGSREYFVLQSALYHGLLPNQSIDFPYDSTISEKVAAQFLKKFENFTVPARNSTLDDAKLDAWIDLMLKARARRQDGNIHIDTVVAQDPDGVASQEEYRILQDVYTKITNDFIDKENVDRKALLQGAIKGLTEAAGDRYTAYFPPQAAKDFRSSLNGEYVGIGAYVDLPQPGVFIITAPLEGSPAEKAGIMPGDRITHVDGEEIADDVGVATIISWIKGEEGTDVVLKISRKINDTEEKELIITVTRGHIVVPSVEIEKINTTTVKIDINMFSETVGQEFHDALTSIDNIGRIERFIIDLQNNPGGSLTEVVRILGHFVPAGEPVVVIKSLQDEIVYRANEVPKDLYIGDKEVVVLTNEGSASASEILAGGVSEYVQSSVIVGEKTFGKGSVQSIFEYVDGSSLKLTIAKWFTGKEQQSIDTKGISPDIEVSDNPETESNELVEVGKYYQFK